MTAVEAEPRVRPRATASFRLWKPKWVILHYASWPKKSVQSSRWHWGQGILPPLPVAREAPWGLRIWCLLWKKKGASEKWSCKTFKQMSSDALCLSSEDTKRVRGILTVFLPNAENSPPTIRLNKKKKKPLRPGWPDLRVSSGLSWTMPHGGRVPVKRAGPP